MTSYALTVYTNDPNPADRKLLTRAPPTP